MKRLLFLLLCLTTYIIGHAEKVTEQQALEKAQQFMQGKSFMQPQRGRQLKGTPQVAEDNAFYIFNIEDNGGFVIVSGDDRMPEILGYSVKGNLNSDKVPSNVKWLLDYYKNAFAAIGKEEAKDAKARTIRPASYATINHLLTTEWDQSSPYNNLCPVADNQTCLTGCVATAMAQVINYHRWPQGNTNSVNAYSTETRHIFMPQLEPTQFQWDNMTDDQIARLMLFCGQSVQMDYGPDNSGANPYLEANALIDVFGYSHTAHLIQHDVYTNDEWDAVIYEELANQRPVIYNGYGNGGGHTFIVEGYDDGRFYINWGWSGNWNGYFLLNGLEPGDGTSYNANQTAVIGIQPPADINDATRPKAVVQLISVSPRNLERETATDAFPVIQLSSQIASDLTTDATFHLGYGLYNDNGLVKVLAERQYNIEANGYTSFDTEATISSDIAIGDYRIKAISRMSETDDWIPDEGSENYYITATISEQKLKMQAWPKRGDENYYEEYGTYTIDGIRYRLYTEYGHDRADVMSLEDDKKYEGDIYLPDYISYDGREFQLYRIGEYVFADCPELLSLSMNNKEGAIILNCPKLKKIELREGMTSFNHPIQLCPSLESIEYPSTLGKLFFAPSHCENLKTIRFKTSGPVTFEYTPELDATSLPALKDIYFLYDFPPTIKNQNSEFKPNPGTTIHIPQGSKASYEASVWNGWTFSEDQAAVPVSVKWGYCTNDNIVGLGLTCGRGENDCEMAIHVPADQIAPYKGMQITSIEFCTWERAVNDYQYEDAEYVFITKPGTDYLVKQSITCNRGVWQTVYLNEPYTITGEELYVGFGRHSIFGVWFSDDVATAPDGVWCRAMGNDTSHGIVPGEWENMASMSPDWNHPMPFRFCISGENMPADLIVGNMEIVEGDEQQPSRKTTATALQPVSMPANKVGNFSMHRDHNSIKMTHASEDAQGTKATTRKSGEQGPLKLRATVTSRTPRVVNSYTLGWSIDGSQSGSQTFNTELPPNHSETVLIDLPNTIVGRNHQVSMDVQDIDGEPDAVASNSNAEVSIVMPAEKHFPRKTVMEEGTGTWCGWCVRGIETIDRLKKEYPENFIAIGVHSSDVMDNAVNYDKLLERFDTYPNSFINRKQLMDPGYWEVKNLVETEKDNADAKITARAFFATSDSSAVKVVTESEFGFSDPDASGYRIAFAVVEDKVGPYVQGNFYSDPSANHTDDIMDEWVHKDSQVEMLFYDVARGIYGDYAGNAKSFTTPITEGETYQYQYSFTLPKNIQNRKNIRIVTLLLDNKNGEILNADQSSVLYDENMTSKYFYLSYQGDEQPNGGVVTIEAEEDDFGFGEMNCETNPPGNPTNGLIVKTKDGKQKSGTARLEITSNTLNAKSIQWCMGGACTPMTNKTSLDKTFTTDENGITQVQFDATNISSYGELEATLTVTIENETSNLTIRFIHEEEPVEPTDIYYRGQQLNTGTRYGSETFNDIKSGSFRISKDKKKLILNNLTTDCQEEGSSGNLFQMYKATTVVLKGQNKLITQGHYVMNPNYGSLTITGSGSMTTSSNWYDFWITGVEMTIENTTLECQGYTAIGDNSKWDGDYLVVKNSTLKGKRLDALAGLTLINCAFKSSKEIIFLPEEYDGLRYADGSHVDEFVIEPVEGDFGNVVVPVDFGKVYVEKGKRREVAVTMTNKGTNAVESVSYVLTNNGQQQTEQTYKLQTPVTKIGSSFEVPIVFEGAASPGSVEAILTVTKVNGQENASQKKDATGAVVTVGEAASRAVVVEEFTGTWCAWCTRGIVGLDLIKKTFGNQVITIAAHSGDPMQAEGYDFIFGRTNSFPSCIINRGELTDPYWGTSGSKPFGIETDIEKELAIPVAGSIQSIATWANEQRTAIKINTRTTFVIDEDSAPYQIGFILLEDGMKGTGSEWAQNNAYAGYSGGDANLRVMGEKSSPITDMEYDHVAVAAWGADKGMEGSVKAPLKQNASQSFTYTADISANKVIQDKSRLSVVALLLDKETGKIINACQTEIGKGDANSDGTVNAADIVEVVKMIMGNPSEGFDEKAADINGDGVVNAADIVEMVNIIMGA